MREQDLPSISTDQVAALVELARAGTLRRAAERLAITEQGLRGRLLVLERRLGAQLYLKSRGQRRGTPLTAQGQAFLPHALAYLASARDLCGLFAAAPAEQRVCVAASQYLVQYVLIDAVRQFHRAFPRIRIRLSTRTEQEIENELVRDPELSLGMAAPYEPDARLQFAPLFSMHWSFIARPGHRLLDGRRLQLADLAAEPLILFERGSSGRQHVVDAFHAAGLAPRIEMETTSTEIVVRMVEAGLGVSIVPLLPDGSLLRGRRVAARSLGRRVRPIQSGILSRRGETLAPACRTFVEFIASTTSRLKTRAGG